MYISDTGGGHFEQAPVGTHMARCIKLIDIGTQRGEYQGQVTFKRQIIVGWELPQELIQTGEYAGKPFTCSKFYTASLSEKATLRADLKNWRTKDFTEDELKRFDLKQILDKPCMVSITHNEKGRVKVTGVMAAPKGLPVPDRVNPLVYFSLERDHFDAQVFESLSDGYKRLIMVSPEWAELTRPEMKQPAGNDEPFDDDIPF